MSKSYEEIDAKQCKDVANNGIGNKNDEDNVNDWMANDDKIICKYVYDVGKHMDTLT